MTESIVSHEVVARIHHDQVRMLVLAAELERAARGLHHDEMTHLAHQLSTIMNEHLRLIEGVLDSLSADEPSPGSVGGA